MSYRPLPKCFTIKNSPIEGLGLFATELILKGSIFGPTHIRDKRFENNLIRTPLGGFINHNDIPNVYLMKPNIKVDNNNFKLEGDFLMIKTLRDIKPGEEILLKYAMYKVKKDVDTEK